MRRGIAVVAAVAIVVLGLGFAAIRRIQQSMASARNPQTVAVQRGSLVATLSAAGVVESTDAVELSFQTSGQVTEIKVQEGQAVEAGQEIACLDSADAQLQVAQAELSLQAAQAKLDQARKGATPEEIAAARASLASAQEALKALQAGPSDTEIEIARLRWEQAKDQLWSTQLRRDGTCGTPGGNCEEARAAVASAEMSVEIARLQYEQARQGASAKELRAAEAQVAQAQLNLSKLLSGPASEDLRAAEIQVKQAELSLQQARAKLAQCCLRAPFAGTITRLALRVGQMAGANTPAATLSGEGGLQISAELSEVDVARVAVGQEVEVLLDAMPERTFAGRVVQMATSGTSSQGVVNFPITICLDQADPAIRPGMTANVTIIAERRDNVLLVPSRAIQVRGGGYLVRVLHEGQIIEVPVQVGLSGDNGTEILGDILREGDLLVVDGATSSPGQVGGFRGFGMPAGTGGVMIRP
ncbi:MAG: efflux RND transporter periplasmic adaptor subunit [Anaerolineae bacterium]|nr:efflux RND transporter periplasmic adaptor subunit [Anaerolineae bacterium]